MTPRRIDPAPWPVAMKVLLVKLSSLGDVIQTMPVVQDVLRVWPQAQIDWVVEEAFAPLVERVEGVRKVLPIAQRRWRKSRFSRETRLQRAAFLLRLQGVRYDAVIDFQGLIKSALVARRAWVTKAGFRATYANGSEACSYEWPVRWMLDRTVPMPRRIHAVARYRQLAASALGGNADGAPVYKLRLQPQAAHVPGERVVVFTHGTTRPDNEWPQAAWLALGQRLIAQGYRIALPHSGALELAFAQRLAAALGAGVDVWPTLTLAQILDRMATASGVIGVDSGLSHMAVALNLPHVQIFSQPRAWRAGPIGQPHQRAVGGATAPGVDEVWRAWQDVATRPL